MSRISENETVIDPSSGRRILSEDEYTEKLEATIEAQFFPHINSLKSLYSYLQGNIDIRDAEISLLQDTGNCFSEDSLSSFFRQFISEDNASFEVLQKKSVAEHRRKYHWVYEIEDSKDNGKMAGMLALYYMNGKVLTLEERKLFDKLLVTNKHLDAEFDTRKNGLDHCKFRVRNQLFFPPQLKDSEDICKIPSQGRPLLSIQDSQSSSLHIANGHLNRDTDMLRTNNNQQLVVLRKDQVSESKGVSKTIQAFNTTNLSGGSSASSQSIRHLLLSVLQRSGQPPLNPFPEGLSPLERPHQPSPYSPAGLFPPPRTVKRRYEEVSMSPSPEPLSSSSPLVTWGELLGEVAELPEQVPSLKRSCVPVEVEEGVPRFSMQPPSRREHLARSLDSHGRSRGPPSALTQSPHASLLSPCLSVASKHTSSAVSVAGSAASRTSSKPSLGGRRSFAALSPAAQALALKVGSKRRKEAPFP
mmetsp:Transcript_20553/g.28321  ORF Transcript_20553/g.28321 Transcript_20553/m.28321 type:complete len:473 (+) Transcript_20553:1-1419(+)